MSSYSQFLQRTLESILRTREHELTCEEVARLLDRYVDQRLAGAVDDSPEMRLVEEHHQICRSVGRSTKPSCGRCGTAIEVDSQAPSRPGARYRGADWAQISTPGLLPARPRFRQARKRPDSFVPPSSIIAKRCHSQSTKKLCAKLGHRQRSGPFHLLPSTGFA